MLNFVPLPWYGMLLPFGKVNLKYKRMKKNVKRIAEWWFLIILLCILPITGLAQDYPTAKVDVSYNTASIDYVLKDLGKRFNMEILYNMDEVKQVKPLTLNMKQVTLKEILDKCFAGTNLSHKLVDKVIVITVKKREDKKEDVRVITGKVLHGRNEPLPGATVMIKGSALGVSSNNNGQFTISIPDQGDVTLHVSFLGMKTQEIIVKRGVSECSVQLEEEEVLIDDVVVTGYGNIRETSFTGSYTKVSQEELLRVSPGSIINALQVFDPGLRVMKNNEMGSDPNTLPEFYIRGQSGMKSVSEMDYFEALKSGEVSKFSLVKNPNTPIFIMDGFEVEVEKIFDMDPHRVKQITILKDAAATAIYGSRAANGVIVIETLAPKAGQFKITYNFVGSVTMPDLTGYNLMNAREKLEAEVAGGLLDGTDNYWGLSSSFTDRLKDYTDKLNMINLGVDTYWLSQPLQTPFNHNHNLYIEGGAESVRLSLSLRYERNNGVMKGSYRDRMGAALIAEYILKKLQIRNNFSFAITNSEDSPLGYFSRFATQQPYDSPTDPLTGEIMKIFPRYINRTAVSQRINPFYEKTLHNESRKDYREWINNFTINWFITEHLRFKGQFAITYKLSDNRVFKDPESGEFENKGVSDRGSLYVSKMDQLSWDGSLLLNYNQAFGKHFITAGMGLNAMENTYEQEDSRYIGFPSGSLSDVSYANRIDRKPTVSDNHTRLIGWFMNANYSYNDIYMLDASVRLDGSSEYGTKSRFAPFWSLGGGINIHNYEYMKVNLPLISRFKLTVTYGITGKANFPPYASRNSYQVDLEDWYKTGMGATLIALGNENLKWERNKTLNLLANIGLWKNKLTATFSWYDKKSIDMISNVGIPLSSGFSSYKENMGEIGNQGIELRLNYRIIETKGLGLTVFGTLGHNRNKLLKLSMQMEAYNKRIDEYFENYNVGFQFQNKDYSQPFTKYIVGTSLNSVTGMKSLGISPVNGKELFEYIDGTVSYNWVTQQQQNLGNSDAKYHGSFGFNFNYKRLSLYTTFLYDGGGYKYNKTLVDKVENLDIYATNADRRVLTDRWRKPGDVTKLKSIYDSNITTRPTSRFVQKNNNLTFNSFSLEYEFDREMVKFWGMDRLKIQFNMNDVFTLSSIKQERGTAYPFARTFNITLNASF